jgi:acetyl-CoA synthetase
MNDVVWRPSQEHLERSRVGRFMRRHGIGDYRTLLRRSVEEIEWFWPAALEDLGFEWYRPFDRLLDLSKGFPWARWFVGGRINIVHHCLDRHLERGRGDRVALLWEGDDGSVRSVTYRTLHEEVGRVAGGLRRSGVGREDAVALYLPMVPEVVSIFFACLKIGAVAVPIFSGFGPSALAARLADASVRMVFTADGGWRRGKWIPVKPAVDEALRAAPSVRRVVVLKRSEGTIPWREGRDVDWSSFCSEAPPVEKTEELDAEDHSMILYTSGTTGRPKGTVHTHAGALAQIAKEVGYAFDLRPDEDRFFWFTDIGWMMGPWEMIGVQFFGGTYLIFEGTPDHPRPDRLWETIRRHRVTTLGISPTAIRMLMSRGDEWVGRHDLGSLRILGSTGEPWDPDSYLWYFEKVGGRRCPVINISGGTELVGCLLSPLPVMPLKVCTLGGPGLGMDVDVVNEEGRSVRGTVGHLVCRKPGPSMTKGFLNDPERYLETYFSKFPGLWYHGDWAMADADGFWFLYGRSDDTIKVAGKRVGPAEIEAVLMEHEAVSEAAAIGIPDEIKGATVVCFVVLGAGREPSEALREELSARVVQHLGKTLRPGRVEFARALPKTRSAKILRGLIRSRYLGEPLGDLASVENPDAIEALPCRGGSDQ